jgi:heme/copper-type cytochrome/quinol oxidase subunit 2
MTIAMAPPISAVNIHDVVAWVISIAVTAIGIGYLFRANGGQDGQRFLERTTSILFVVLIRWIVLAVIPAMVVYFTAYELLFEIPENTTLADAIIVNLMGAGYYWRCCVHLSEVASPVSPAAATGSR